jgi:hypothetical protein
MIKTVKWQLLKSESFQRPVHQLIAALLMVALNRSLRSKKVIAAISF